MKLSYLSNLAIASLSAGQSSSLALAEICTEGVDVPCETLTCTQDSVAFAYMYGFPLYSYGVLVQNKGASIPNMLMHQTILQTAGDESVVRPNADTLYSATFIDLSDRNLEITVPDFGERYGVFPFYDLYGNNIANIGSLGKTKNGTFLLRYDQDNIGIITEGIEDGYDGYVNMPTPYGVSIARIVVSNTTEDMAVAHSLQGQLKVTPVFRPGPPVAPPLDLSIFRDPNFNEGNDTSLEEAILRLTAVLAPYNEPEVAQDRHWVAQSLSNAGMKNGLWIQPPGTNLTAAVNTVNRQVALLLATPGYIEHLSNNWTSLDSRIIGDYQSYYQARYAISGTGYLGLTADQASYLSFDGIDQIGADEAVLFQFSNLPVIEPNGFWSLTAYGADQFFISNELNRYAIGDRNNITFPDGSLVYFGKEDELNDGPFEILLQPANIAPPDNWTNNWLPAPSGGGALSFTLRWYGAENAMSENGSYVYPKVSVIDAITA